MTVRNLVKPNVVAIVPAAGLGVRAQLGPKAFLKIDGVDLVTHVVRTLSPLVSRVLVALPPDCLDQAGPLLTKLAEVIPGRRSRHATVGALLEQCREEFVIIQDVSRPFASANLIERILDGVWHAGAAATVLEQNNPVARYVDGYLVEALPRESVRQVQTPLAFKRSILNEAYIRGVL
jgi:4-diphosphocytidyl-2-methyl-D-erithritol synthase